MQTWLWWYYWWWWWLLPGSWGGKGGISRLAGHRPPAPRISPCWSSGWSWWSSRWTFHYDDGDCQWQFVKFMMMIFLSALHSWLLDLPTHCEKHSLNHFKTSYWPRQELLKPPWPIVIEGRCDLKKWGLHEQHLCTTWNNLDTTLRQLGHIFARQPWDNLEKNFRQFWDSFDTHLRELEDHWETT